MPQITSQRIGLRRRGDSLSAKTPISTAAFSPSECLLMFSILFAPRRKTIKSERGVRVSNIGYQSINIEGRTTTYFDGGTNGRRELGGERGDDPRAMRIDHRSVLLPPAGRDGLVGGR